MVNKLLCTTDDIIKFTDFLIAQDIGFTLNCDRYTYDDYHKNVTILKNDNLGKYFRFHYNAYWQELVCDIIPIEVSDPKNADGYSYGRPDSSLKYKFDITWYGNTIYFYKVNYDNWGIIVQNNPVYFGVTTAKNKLTNENEILFIKSGCGLISDSYEDLGKPDDSCSYISSFGNRIAVKYDNENAIILKSRCTSIKKEIMLDTIYSYYCNTNLVNGMFYKIGSDMYYNINSDNKYLVKV